MLEEPRVQPQGQFWQGHSDGNHSLVKVYGPRCDPARPVACGLETAHLLPSFKQPSEQSQMQIHAHAISAVQYSFAMHKPQLGR